MLTPARVRTLATRRPVGVIEHYLQMNRPTVVNTPDFALALENVRYVRRRHAISLFFGDPGVGKTIAAHANADSSTESTATAGCAA